MRHFYVLALALGLLCACQGSFDERCAREAAEYTKKNCPQQLEPGNTLDSMIYDIPSRTYFYYYTLSGPWDTPSDVASLRQQSEILRGHLIDALNNSIELKACKDEGIDFAYVYISASTGKEILKIRLTPKDYRH